MHGTLYSSSAFAPDKKEKEKKKRARNEEQRNRCSPVIVKYRIPGRLFEAALVDGPHGAGIIDAQLVWAHAHKSTQLLVSEVQDAVLPSLQANDQDPQRRKGDRPMCRRDFAQGGYECWIDYYVICEYKHWDRHER